jgi:8-hydroxy-5-deazaflavin:NADPH oxidoreductase
MERARIGILGSGMVGQAPARGFAGRGHDVRIGSRGPDKLAGFATEAGVGTGTFDEVAEHGELVVIATLGAGAEEAVALAGPERLAGKVLIDTGGIEGARLLEPLTILWVVVGLRRGAWDHAFKVVAGA